MLCSLQQEITGMQWLSFNVDGCHSKTRPVVGYPDRSFTKHHAFVSGEDRLKGRFGHGLANARGHDRVLRRNELIAVANAPPNLSCHGQRIVGDTGEEL